MAKEKYYEVMHELTQLRSFGGNHPSSNGKDKGITNPFVQPTPSYSQTNNQNSITPAKKLAQLRLKAEASESDYKSKVDKVNLYVDMMNTAYLQMLNRIQDSDEGMIGFVKFYLEKFA